MVLPETQKVAVNYVLSGGAANSGLTLAKMVEAKSILGKNEFPAGSMLYLVVSQQQIDDLLNNVTQVSSADYAAVKALQQGTVTNFMGFEFIKTELLAHNSSTDVRTCFAYVRDCLLMSVGEDVTVRIDELPEHNYSTQVYTRMSIGPPVCRKRVSSRCPATRARDPSFNHQPIGP